MDIAYLGPRGTFTERAAATVFSSSSDEYRPMSTISDVLDAVLTGEVDAGVAPMENSIQGTVHPTIDGLLMRPNLQLVRQVILPIRQHLLVLKLHEPLRAEEVWSHPQALAQCRTFIHHLGAREVVYPSTAAAAYALADSGREDVCVIASDSAAREAGLYVARENIADCKDNWTRFAVVYRQAPGQGEEIPPRRVGGNVSQIKPNTPERVSEDLAHSPKKTLLVVIPVNESAGVLASILHVFAALGQNLSFIESRPTRVRLGTYQFILEIDAEVSSPQMATAIRVLQAFGHDVRCLGCYDTLSVSAKK